MEPKDKRRWCYLADGKTRRHTRERRLRALEAQTVAMQRQNRLIADQNALLWNLLRTMGSSPTSHSTQFETSTTSFGLEEARHQLGYEDLTGFASGGDFR